MTRWTVSLILDGLENPPVPCSTTTSARKAMLAAIKAMDTALGTVTKAPSLSAPTWQRECNGVVYAGNVCQPIAPSSCVLVSAVCPEKWPGGEG